MRKSKLRQIVREEIRKKLTEASPGEEAKKRGLKHIGFGRYVDPSEPSKVVAKSEKGKLVAVGGKGTEAPAGKKPSAAERGKAKGKERAKTVSKIAKGDNPTRSAKEFSEPLYMRERGGGYGRGSAGRWVRVREARATENGRIQVRGPEGRGWQSFAVTGERNPNIEFAKRSPMRSDRPYHSPKGMPVDSAYAASVMFSELGGSAGSQPKDNLSGKSIKQLRALQSKTDKEIQKAYKAKDTKELERLQKFRDKLDATVDKKAFGEKP